MPRRQCAGTTKRGTPCKAAPLTGSDYCLAHQDEQTRALVGFGGAENGALGGKPRKPTPSEVQRRLIEENIAVVVRPHFRTLGYDVVVDEHGARLEPVDGGGAKVYGESKDGDIRMSPHDDLAAMMTASEKLQDRVYGRPKQQTEISGPDGQPVQVASTFDLSKLTVQEKRDLLRLLEKADAGTIG